MFREDFFLVIPAQPDVTIQDEVDDATFGASQSKDVTCQVEIRCGPELSSPWGLFSCDSTGRRKTKGGDEFYIRYEEYIHKSGDERVLLLQAVSMITDHKDGSYSLHFVTTPTNPNLPVDNDNDSATIESTSELTIFFEYSNGIGLMPPPTKASWKNGGYTHKRCSISPCSRRPPIRVFCPPSTESCGVNLRAFQKVFFFGDSTMDQFVRQRPNKKGKYYFQPNIKVGEKIRLGLNNETIHNLLEQLHHEFGDEILQARKEGSVALVVGSCLWDVLDADDTIQGQEYQDHLTSCRLYIEGIRKRYPGVDIVWKSPMAVHIHVVDLDRLVEHDRATATLFGISRVRYMSATRAKYLYHSQKNVMEELEVPVLDLFEATYLSSDRLYPSDGRHYRPDLNRLMLSFFFAD
jgi:hypothetical protein